MTRWAARLPVRFYLVALGLCFVGMAWSLRSGTGFGVGAFTWLTRPMIALAGVSVLMLAWRRSHRWWAGSAALVMGSVSCRLAEVGERVVRSGWSWPAVLTTCNWLALAVLSHFCWHYIKEWVHT